MFINLSKILFILILALGTLISISRNSWIGVWVGLEINLLSFIPLITSKSNLNNSEAALNYFLVQAFASTIILFGIIIYTILQNTNFYINIFIIYINNYNISISLIILTLILKIGAAPFHLWFPNVIENISWNNSLILITWQKIAPIIILSYLINLNIILIIFTLISTLIGAIGGLNQISLRKLIAFSSINHIGWIIMTILFNENLWLIYFLIYSFLNFSIIYLFKNFQIFYLNQIYSIFINSYFLKFRILISTLSLGGLPPFLGFLPKWFVIQSLIFIKINFINFFIICIRLITLFYYLKIRFSAFILNYNELNWNIKNHFKNNKFFIIINLNFITLGGFFAGIELIY